MKILIDMNLSPGWCAILRQHGWEAEHWSTLGDPRAPDRVVMQYARGQGYVVLTHDLDFGTLLAATGAVGPSVIQVRTRDIMPDRMEHVLVAALRQFEPFLIGGALVVVDEGRARARVLPLNIPRDAAEDEQ
jgi:predicted nuclease of predicted toxin-antitoxin system